MTCTMPECQTTAGCKCSDRYKAEVDKLNRTTESDMFRELLIQALAESDDTRGQLSPHWFKEHWTNQARAALGLGE